MTLKRNILRMLFLLLTVPALHAGSSLLPPDSQIIQSAYAQDWKKEFAEICGKTDDAMSLSQEELKQLIEQCDKLKPIIEKQEETERKVYLKRLRLCRELFAYVLESNKDK
ncbi:MAG: hypothetical protein FIA94_11185 [Nitrospirae bacterium]|nr:hypothetical protein [Nitrospirota bacterium]